MEDYNDDETLDSLIAEAVDNGFEYALVQAQRNNREAQEFINSYLDYYRSDHSQPPKELCQSASTYVIRSLASDPHQVNAPEARWAGILSVGLVFATPIVAVSADNLWYAAGTLAGSVLSFFARQTLRAASARQAASLQSIIHPNPEILAPYIKESRHSMGHQLFMYGALHENQIRDFGRHKRRRRHRAKF